MLISQVLLLLYPSVQDLGRSRCCSEEAVSSGYLIPLSPAMPAGVHHVVSDTQPWTSGESGLQTIVRVCDTDKERKFDLECDEKTFWSVRSLSALL